MNLYNMNRSLEEMFYNAVDIETGEIKDEELLAAFDQLQMERDEKIENIACWIKDLKAESEAIGNEINKLRNRKATADRKLDAMRAYLSDFLNGQKFKTGKVSIRWMRTKSVNVTDLSQIPEEFTKITVEPRKIEIKKAIAEGRDVPGAEVVENNNMVIS